MSNIKLKMRAEQGDFELAIMDDGTSTTGQVDCGEPDVVPLDHFLCYKADPLQDIVSDEFTLKDQFDDPDPEFDVDVELLEAKLFCNPVKKTHGEDVAEIGDPVSHLTAYKIKIENEDSEDLQVVISNQFGEQTLLVKESELMFVPSIKTFVDSVAEAGDLLGVDHFKCHKADGFDDIADLGENEGDPVFLDDQFSDGEYENIEVKKAILFCNPATKFHNETTFEIMNEAEHLTCYEIAGDDDTVERIVRLDNQFGFDVPDGVQDGQNLLVKEYELLCLPSEKISFGPDPEDNDAID